MSILLAVLTVASTATICLFSVSAKRGNREYVSEVYTVEAAPTSQIPTTTTTRFHGNNTFGRCGEDLKWIFDAQTGDLMIYGTGEMENFAPERIPWNFLREDIRTLAFSDDVTSICSWAFDGCSNLTKVTFGNRMTRIGVCAFRSCESLVNVTIPAGVTGIGEYAFDSCVNLSSFNADKRNPMFSSDADGVLYNKKQTLLIQYPIGNDRNTFVLPDSVTIIGEGAFHDAKNLMSVTIPDGVTTICNDAFFGCTGLQFVHVPESVCAIGYYNFIYYDFSDQEYRPLPLYICSETPNGYAKRYADNNGLGFLVCKGHKAAVRIRSSAQNVNARANVTFTSSVSNGVNGAKVHWFVNGKDVGTGNSYTAKQVKTSFSVQAKYIKNGKILAESKTEKINVLPAGNQTRRASR